MAVTAPRYEGHSPVNAQVVYCFVSCCTIVYLSVGGCEPGLTHTAVPVPVTSLLAAASLMTALVALAVPGRAIPPGARVSADLSAQPLPGSLNSELYNLEL